MKYMDNSRPSKYIIYLDANNLDGWTMSQYLSCSNFKGFNQKEIDKFHVNLIDENSLDQYC